MQKPANAKGTRDFGPEVVKRRDHILHTIKQVFVKYGFEPIQTPALENLSTLTGKYGNEGDKLLFKVLNSGDIASGLQAVDRDNWNSDALVRALSEKGLRYDLTVPFARFVAQHRNEIQFPFRRYQIQEVWRADRPQKGRYREFTQCDADIIGSTSLSNEADLILIYEEVFKGLGLEKAVLKINHRMLLEALVKLLKMNMTLAQFSTILDKLDKIGAEGVVSELVRHGVDQNTCDRLFAILERYELNSEDLDRLELAFDRHPRALEAIAQLREILGYLGERPELRIELDLSLARGLDYYTGCIFEAVLPESGIGSISGGGRYDDLTGVFGLKDVSGVGISFGIDRIYDVLDQLGWNHEAGGDLVDVLFCHMDAPSRIHAFGLARKVRNAGIRAEVYPDLKRINKQLDYANKSGRSHVVVVGEDEMESGVLTIKDMKTGTSSSSDIAGIIAQLNG